MITIHKVKLEEISEVKELLSHTWKDTYGSFLSSETIDKIISSWHDPKLLANQAQNPDIFFGVAKNEKGEIVGLVTVRKIDNETLMMYRLYVHRDYQRQGIGKKLMNEAINIFPQTKKLRLEVEEQNNKGLSFYLKQGFKEVERKDNKVENETMKVIVMEKEI